MKMMSRMVARFRRERYFRIEKGANDRPLQACNGSLRRGNACLGKQSVIVKK